MLFITYTINGGLLGPALLRNLDQAITGFVQRIIILVILGNTCAIFYIYNH